MVPKTAMNAQFELACADFRRLPAPALVEVALVGRSNCGKSSLINVITGCKGLARTSRTPGRTRQIVFFRICAPEHAPFFVVDLPGYGYARASRAEQRAWARLVNRYIYERETLNAVLLLADIRRDAGGEELELLRWARLRQLGTRVLLTKADKLAKSQRFAAAQRWKDAMSLDRRPLVVSVHDAPAIAAARDALLGLAAVG